MAFESLDALRESTTLSLLAEGDGYVEVLQRTLDPGRVSGPMVHEARIAALCIFHGVSELWSSDRDFGRFPELKVRNPLVG